MSIDFFKTEVKQLSSQECLNGYALSQLITKKDHLLKEPLAVLDSPLGDKVLFALVKLDEDFAHAVLDLLGNNPEELTLIKVKDILSHAISSWLSCAVKYVTDYPSSYRECLNAALKYENVAHLIIQKYKFDNTQLVYCIEEWESCAEKLIDHQSSEVRNAIADNYSSLAEQLVSDGCANVRYTVAGYFPHALELMDDADMFVRRNARRTLKHIENRVGAKK